MVLVDRMKKKNVALISKRKSRERARLEGHTYIVVV